MPIGIYTRPPVQDRFWSKVDQAGPVPTHCPHLGPCWIWTGARHHDGRGKFGLDGRTRYAHVVAYILTEGHEPPAETPEITHLCDGGDIGCVRPSHLKADTHASNQHGMKSRYRAARGTRNGAAKLTAENVLEIRQRYAEGNISQSALGAEYGITQTAVGLITRGDRWAHV